MLTEEEYSILRALVEEEMGYLDSEDTSDLNVMTKYHRTLKNIVDELKGQIENLRVSHSNMHVNVMR